MRHILIFLTVAFSCICTAAEDTESKIDAAKAAIVAILKDPESAKFQNVRVVENSRGSASVVGEVNARNSYGGFVGFKPFIVSGDYAALVDGGESLRRFKLAGGAGPQGELEARLEDEAKFQAEVVWALIANVIVHGQTPEEAVEASLVAIRNRAKENGGELQDGQMALIRQQYHAAIDRTLKDKNQVKGIKSNPDYQKAMFIPVLYTSTLTQLRAQMGLK